MPASARVWRLREDPLEIMMGVGNPARASTVITVWLGGGGRGGEGWIIRVVARANTYSGE